MYARNIGILFAYSLGTYYNYITSSMVFTGITIMFFITFWFIPSTPQYFLLKNNIKVRLHFNVFQLTSFIFFHNRIWSSQAAEQAFNFYNKHKVQTDMKYFSTHFDRLKIVANDAKSESNFVWNDIICCGILFYNFTCNR